VTADAYVIVHQSRYQRTKEAVVRQHEVNRENGAKGGRPPKPPREQFKPNRETHSLTHSLTESVSIGFLAARLASRQTRRVSVKSGPEKPIR
jgi:hypothetical protein